MNKQVFFAPFRLDWRDFYAYRLHVGLPLPNEAIFESECYVF